MKSISTMVLLALLAGSNLALAKDSREYQACSNYLDVVLEMTKKALPRPAVKRVGDVPDEGEEKSLNLRRLCQSAKGLSAKARNRPAMKEFLSVCAVPDKMPTYEQALKIGGKDELPSPSKKFASCADWARSKLVAVEDLNKQLDLCRKEKARKDACSGEIGNQRHRNRVRENIPGFHEGGGGGGEVEEEPTGGGSGGEADGGVRKAKVK